MLQIPPQPNISLRRVIGNGGFESDLTGWTATPGETFVDDVIFRIGTKSARIERMGSVGSWASLIWPVRFPVEPGQVVNWRGYGKSQNGLQHHTKVTWYDSAGATISNSQVAPGGTDGTWDWTQFSGSGTAPANTVVGEFAVLGGWSQDGSNPAMLWVDDLDVWIDDFTEGPYSEVELAFIEEQPERFPTNQNSNWGFLRKVFCGQLQILVTDQETIWRNRFLDTTDEYLHMWEEMLGLPVNPPEELAERIGHVKGRLYKGLFTRTQRHEIVHGFIEATMGMAPQFSEEGLELTASGIILMADPVVDILDHHVILENIENFSYHVGVDRALGIDLVGLTRELLRYTPSGISFTVTEDYFETLGATSAASGGFVIQRPL